MSFLPVNKSLYLSFFVEIQWSSGLCLPLWVNCYHLLQTPDPLPSLLPHTGHSSPPLMSFSALAPFTLPFRQPPALDFLPRSLIINISYESSEDPFPSVWTLLFQPQCPHLKFYLPDSIFAPVSEFSLFYARTPKQRLGLFPLKTEGRGRWRYHLGLAIQLSTQ